MTPRRIAVWSIGVGLMPVAIALCLNMERAWDALQVGTVLGTAIVVYWYTVETQRLRELAEVQVAAQHAATRAAHQPVVVGSVESVGLKLRNVGTGPAFAIRCRFDGDLETVRTNQFQVLVQGEPERILRLKLPGGDPQLGHADVAVAVREAGGGTFALLYRDLAGEEYRSDMELDRLGHGTLVKYHPPSEGTEEPVQEASADTGDF